MSLRNVTAVRSLVEQLRSQINATGVSISVYAEPYHDDLLQLHELFSGLPEIVLLIGHCCFCAGIVSKSVIRNYWLISFWVTFLAGFGGGTLASLIMQDSPVWLKEDYIIFLFFLCWWAVLYSPGKFGISLYNFLPAKAVFKASSNILRARVIMTRVDLVMKRFGVHSIVAPIFLGTLSGSGGRLLTDLALFNFQIQTPIELSKPSWSLRSAFFVALAYVSAVYWVPILPREAAQPIFITFLLAQGLASDFTGMPLDVTSPFADLFHLLTGIPSPPGGAPSVKEVKKLEGKKVEKKKK